MNSILQIVFPEGNAWLYPVASFWYLSMAIVFIAFPLMLTSTGYWYEHETGVSVNFDNGYISGAASGYRFAFLIWQISFVFFAVSIGFDMYYFFMRKRHEAGYL